MLILGVTTSTDRCGVALWRDGDVLGDTVFAGSRTCVEELIPRVDELLKGAGAALEDIDRFAIDIGPGGMTGLKIGVVAVKTLAQVAEKPLVPVSALRALCHGARGCGDVFFPIVKCMRREFFTAVYRVAGESVELARGERLVNEALLRERLAALEYERIVVTGDAVESVRETVDEILSGAAAYVDGALNFPAAVSVCEIAAGAVTVGYEAVKPNYLCVTKAERDFGVEV